MIEKPKLKNCFRVEKVEGESVFLLSERGTILLSDTLYQKLIPLIDGTRSQEEIVAQLRNEIPDAYIYFALMELEQKGFLGQGEENLPPDLVLLCEYLNIKPEDAQKRLNSTRVTITTLGSANEGELREILAALHLQIGEPADLEIVLTDNYLHPELAQINQKHLQTSLPWLLVKPQGILLWIGPIFQPQQTACWECLAQRLRNNQPVESFIHRRRGTRSPLTPPLADIPAHRQTALNMAANEVLKWILQGENKPLQGAIATYDPLTLSLQNHAIVHRPQCPTCGFLKPPKRPLPVIIGSRKKKFTADGGHRCATPEETLAKYQHHISPITGVVRSLEKIAGDDNSLTHIYRAQHHHFSMFDTFLDLQKNIGGRSAGKGRTDAQGKASGFGEAIERYSSMFQGDELRIRGSYRSLREKAIHPNACMNFSPAQYQSRREWNAANPGAFQRVPEPFDENEEMDWTPIWSLNQQNFKYLPTAYCYFGYPRPEKPSCWANTNGCAAGNTTEEAILQGFLELVERDGIALWWYNRLSRPAIALESFEDDYFQAVGEYYDSLGRDLWVLDLTSDLNIPTFGAISRRRGDIEDIILGFGSHFDPKLALQRALTELGQVLPAVLSANPDGSTHYSRSVEPHILHWWKTATIENQPYLSPNRQIPARRHDNFTVIRHDDLLEDIQYCQQLMAEKGMEILVLDQTRPDVGLNVVKVIVPGLRLFWRRLDAGRLYDVPVQLGWLKEPLPEEKLNPIPLWL